MKRVEHVFCVAIIAIAVGVGFYSHEPAIGAPVSDEAAASILGGCNGPTTGNLNPCGAGCPGTGALAVTTIGDFHSATGSAGVCTTLLGSCITAPTCNPMGCTL